MSEKLHSEPTQAQPSVSPKLEITKGEFIGKTFNLKMKTTVGRELDNDIVLVDPKISRYHAQIILDDGQWVITDLGSSNQTFVNDKPISDPTPLQPDDRISLGEIELAFRGAVGQAETTAARTVTKTTPTASEPAAAQPASGGLPRLVWLAGAFILLLCVGAAVAIFFISRLSPGEEAVTVAGNTPAPLENTDGSADDSPSEESVDISGAGSGAENLSLTYEEDFSDPFSGWDDAFDAYTTKQYGNNRYQIEVSTSNLIAWGLANRDVADFEVEVEARQEDGSIENSYGLLFRVQDRNNFYRFDISSDGFYLLSKFVEGEWETLVDWTASEHISPETNLLKVSAFGPEITINANGQPLTTITDESLTHGNFGFFASTFNEPYMWVSYDNLKLWTPEGTELTLIPTATRPAVTLADAGTASASPTAMETETEAVAETETALPDEAEDEAGEEDRDGESVEAIAEADVDAESGTITATVALTTTPAADTTPAPTATPRPLPDYASRAQILARGEEAVTGRIIFPLYDPERGTYDIYMADAADGDNLELIQENASQPALNEDGTEMAYRSWQPDNRGLFARPLGGDHEDAWRFDSFFESARPQFSPVDGSLMYHSRTGGREPAIYRVIDGEGLVMRRDGGPIQGEAAKWSPDGQQFIYNSCIGGKCGLILSNIDGTNPTLLTDDPSDTNPEISPDGSTVAFMSKRSGDWEIYRVDIDGQNLTALTADDANDGLPTWSPDGEKIAYVANRDGKWAMWDMDPDGNNQRRLFLLDKPVDGIVEVDQANSRGWLEENIDWQP